MVADHEPYGAVAAEHHVALGTRDLRALDTYRALGADVEMLGDG